MLIFTENTTTTGDAWLTLDATATGSGETASHVARGKDSIIVDLTYTHSILKTLQEI